MDGSFHDGRRARRHLATGTALGIALALVAGAATLAGATTRRGPHATSTATQVALRVPAKGSGGFNYTQGSYLEGFEFRARTPITVTALGAYDSNLSALPNGAQAFATVPVALYDMTTRTLLGSVEVTAADPATGVYRYAALAHDVRLSTTHVYSVAWVSLSNHYVASPKLTLADVNAHIAYLAMDGNGPGGLTQVTSMVRPNWFFTYAKNGIAALNYDLGSNFAFTLAR